MKPSPLLMAIALACAFLHPVRAAEPSRIYFVRHAETFSNAGGKAATGNTDIHSLGETGQKQAQALIEKLRPHTFTAIAVSPMDRAIATAAPYLRATGRRAEVWPELAECCYHKDREAAALGVEPIRLFVAPDFAADVLDIPKTKPPHWLRVDTYQDGLEQIRMAKARIDDFTATPGRTLLLIGHSLMGGRLIELMTTGGFQEKLFLQNACVSVLRREPDGSYVLEKFNDRDVAPAKSGTQTRQPAAASSPP